jgi:hypothetical protein
VLTELNQSRETSVEIIGLWAHAERQGVYDFIFVLLARYLNYNFACGSVWVWNLVSDIRGGTD